MGYNFNPFTGNLDDVGAGGAGSTPGGSDTQVQFNDGGSFGGSADLTWDDTAKELGVGGDISLDSGGTYSTTLQMVTPTANRTISFPDATGTVALVSGSNGTVQYNEGGVLKGNSDFTVDPDWNDASTVFTGLKLNVTDTASAAGSNLLDLQVGGTAISKISSDGDLYLANIGATAGALLLENAGYGRFGFKMNGSASYHCYFAGNILVGDAERYTGVLNLGFADSSADAADTFLKRDDAAGVLAQRNGTNAQTYRLYNTYTDASNYERGFFQWNSNVLEIGPEAAGTGTARPMRITAATLKLPNLPTYADNTAATSGGLVAGDVYQTATGELRITV